MRFPLALAVPWIVLSSTVLAPSVVRAEEPSLERAAPHAARLEHRDPGPALVAGAAILLAGFAVGATLASTAQGENGTTNAGWYVMQSGMVLAPMGAHLMDGAWARGLAYSAVPAGTLAGTAALFTNDPGCVLHGSLSEQRAMWGLFGGGLLASLVGIVAVTWGPAEVQVAPAVARDQVGLQIVGAL